MQITRKSMFSGKYHTIDLPITEDQIKRSRAGALIQDAFPQLEPWQREYYMTGVTKEEWDQEFGKGSSDKNSERYKKGGFDEQIGGK